MTEADEDGLQLEDYRRIMKCASPKSMDEPVLRGLEDALADGDHPSSMRFMSLAKIKPGWWGDTGRTMLHAAAEGGSVPSLEALFEQGRAEDDLDAVTCRGGATALMLACTSGHENAARYLLEKGPDVRKLDAYGRNVLYHAISAKYRKLSMDLLLAGVDPTVEASNGLSPIRMAMRAGMVDVLTMCLCRGGATPSMVHAAVRDGEVKCLEAVLRTGVNADTEDDFGVRPLGIAVSLSNSARCVEMLAKRRDVNVNVTGKHGERYIATAVRRNKHRTARALLKNAFPCSR